jgi:23S rRNA pseudouridine2605 synthase
VAAVRLQKLLAEAGIASRRGAERLIQSGRVRVNGEAVVELGAHADPERDRISVDGREIGRAEPKRYVLLHKPAGYLTTREDPRGRQRVYDLLPDLGVRLHSVGRLDYDAEGLLLLTNDGDLTYRLTHPRHAVPRVYHVWVDGRADRTVLAALRDGVVLEDGPARPEEVLVLSGLDGGPTPGGEGRARTGRRPAEPAGERARRGEGTPAGDRQRVGQTWLAVTLREGRYREVKRLCRAVGLRVRRLVRVAYGPLRLGRLAPGTWRDLTPCELAALRGAGDRAPAPGPSPAR